MYFAPEKTVICVSGLQATYKSAIWLTSFSISVGDIIILLSPDQNLGVIHDLLLLMI